MNKLLFRTKDAVDRRLRCQVLSPVGRRRNNLIRREIAKLGRVDSLEDLRTLPLGELVRRVSDRTLATIFTTTLGAVLYVNQALSHD